MKYTPEQEISETNETAVYEPRKTCSTCPIASQCAAKNYPPCNMIMVVWRDEAAHGMVSEAFLKQLEEQYRAWEE